MIGSVSAMMSEAILKNQWLFDAPRAERAPVSPVHRSALLGQSLTWRPAGAGLRAFAMRVRLVLRLGGGGGGGPRRGRPF